MDAPFNPFQVWLQHPLSTQSLSFYQLVGLNDFEGQTDKIAAACDKSIAKVRACKPGSQARLWARFLDILQQVKAILTNPEKRASYDKRLKAGAPQAFITLAALTEAAKSGDKEKASNGKGGAEKPAANPAAESATAVAAPSESVSDLLPPSADLPPEADAPTAETPAAPVMPVDPAAQPYPAYGQPGAYPQPPAGYGAPGYPGAYSQAGYPQPGYPQAGYPQAGYPQAQMPYGQPAYGQPPYGQPAYGQSPYGQPGYPQAAYGQPAYPQPGAPWQQAPAGAHPGYPGAPGQEYAMGSPAMATPVMGVPAMATPAMPAEPAIAIAEEKSSLTERKGKSRSKGIAVAICATLLLLTAGGGVFYVLNQGKPTETVQNGDDNKTSTTDDGNKNNQWKTDPVGPSGDNAKNQVADSGKSSTDTATETTKPEESTTEEEMPSEETTSEMPAEEMTTEEETPAEEATSEEEMPAEEMTTEKEPTEAMKPATGDATEEPAEEMISGEPLTEEELAELSKLLNQAKTAMTKFDFPKLDEIFPAAEKLAHTAETKGLVDRLSTLAMNAAECRAAIVESIRALKGGDEVELKNSAKTRFSVVEVAENKFTIFMSGQRRSFTYDNLPMGLAVGLADRRLSTTDPSNLGRKGAYLVLVYWADRTSPKPLQAAKEMFNEAKLGGVDTDDLLAVLDDDYDSLKGKK